MAGKQPEQELLTQMRQSLGLLQVAFDSASDAMVILDHDHTIRWANQRSADRFSQGFTTSLISHPFANRIKLIAPYGGSQILKTSDHLHHLLHKPAGETRLRVTSIQSNNETTAPLNNVSWKKITSINNTFYLLAFRNLDPMEQALEQQRLFVQQLGHELRTPLALLSGSLRRLSRFVTTPSRAFNALQTAEAVSHRLKSLVDHLMLLSDLETGLYPWAIQEQSLNDSITSWIQSLPKQQQSLINLKSDLNNDSIRFDSHALTIILGNLLTNSLRFGDQDASITIRLKKSNKGVKIFFEDTGPGLTNTSEDNIDSIFERFQRLEQHRSNTRAEGCGLGLTVVRELIHGMGAEVAISRTDSSDSENYRGTSIFIFFPTEKSTFSSSS